MPTTLGKYVLGRTLGSGVSCKVKLAKDSSGQRYAIKIIHSDATFDELVEKECEALAQLQHRNIVRLVEVNQGQQTNPKKGSKSVKYIVLELIGGGELFDFVALGGRLSEDQGRYYFKQLLEGLGYMHKQGIVHRDLKPENLLLDKDYVLKITDFGFAAKAAGSDGSGLLHTQLGTANYMAPEIHIGRDYEGARVDLFAAAIILFVILTQRPPFLKAHPQDPHYRLIAAGRAELFWQAHADAEQGQDIYSAEFKDLFQKMMTLNPAQRPTIEDIMSHPWMAGNIPSDAAIKQDFTVRKGLVDAEAHNEREAKRAQRQEAQGARDVRRSDGAMQEDGEEVENQREAWSSLEIDEYGPYYMQDYTQFFMTTSPLDFFDDFVLLLQKRKIKNNISGDKLKLTFNAFVGGSSPEEESKDNNGREVSVAVQVLRVDDQKNCVKFSYRDPASKKDVRKTPDIIEHFLSFRNAPELIMFVDTTFEESH